MIAAADYQTAPGLELSADQTPASRRRMAVDDLLTALRLWRLPWMLGWLDIKLRYRGSVLGPFWLTLSTAVMVAALGVLYSTLLRTNLHDYLPFLALSMVLWNYVATLVGDACLTFTAADGMIRSIRMPYTQYALRVVVRNVLMLLHNIVVIVAVFAIFDTWPGWHGLMALPGVVVWLVDSLAACLLLGTFCARFRDIPPIVASIMQIAFFISPIIWRPDLVGPNTRYLLPLNPFFTLLEIVRGPLLGEMPGATVWLSAGLYSLVLCAGAGLLFARARGRVAFWV